MPVVNRVYFGLVSDLKIERTFGTLRDYLEPNFSQNLVSRNEEVPN